MRGAIVGLYRHPFSAYNQTRASLQTGFCTRACFFGRTSLQRDFLCSWTPKLVTKPSNRYLPASRVCTTPQLLNFGLRQYGKNRRLKGPSARKRIGELLPLPGAASSKLPHSPLLNAHRSNGRSQSAREEPDGSWGAFFTAPITRLSEWRSFIGTQILPLSRHARRLIELFLAIWFAVWAVKYLEWRICLFRDSTYRAPYGPLNRLVERYETLSARLLPNTSLGYIVNRKLGHINGPDFQWLSLTLFTYQFVHGGFVHLVGNAAIFIVLAKYLAEVITVPQIAVAYLAGGWFAIQANWAWTNVTNPYSQFTLAQRAEFIGCALKRNDKVRNVVAIPQETRREELIAIDKEYISTLKRLSGDDIVTKEAAQRVDRDLTYISSIKIGASGSVTALAVIAAFARGQAYIKIPFVYGLTSLLPALRLWQAVLILSAHDIYGLYSEGTRGSSWCHLGGRLGGLILWFGWLRRGAAGQIAASLRRRVELNCFQMPGLAQRFVRATAFEKAGAVCIGMPVFLWFLRPRQGHSTVGMSLENDSSMSHREEALGDEPPNQI